MVENIPRGTKRCVRAATCAFYEPNADVEVPLDVRGFRRAIGYGTREVVRDEPEPGMTTYVIGCAVTGCNVVVEIVNIEATGKITAMDSQDMETCRRE